MPPLPKKPNNSFYPVTECSDVRECIGFSGVWVCIIQSEGLYTCVCVCVSLKGRDSKVAANPFVVGGGLVACQ